MGSLQGHIWGHHFQRSYFLLTFLSIDFFFFLVKLFYIDLLAPRVFWIPSCASLCMTKKKRGFFSLANLGISEFLRINLSKYKFHRRTSDQIWFFDKNAHEFLEFVNFENFTNLQDPLRVFCKFTDSNQKNPPIFYSIVIVYLKMNEI